MEGTKPLDRLVIQGNGSTPRDESSSKKPKDKNLQLSVLPDIASSTQFFKTFPHFRRYAFPEREAHSEYGSQMSENESNEKFLKVRGKTIYWDSEMNSSSVNHSELSSRNSLSVVDGSSPGVVFEVNDDKVNQRSEHNRVGDGEENENKSSRPNVIDRNSRLRHSYHGPANLSLTGQKLTTPRDCDKNNEKHPSDSLPPSASGREEPFSMSSISARSPRHMRHERAETSHYIAPQRAVRSALLKQCLRIQKPRQDNEVQPATFVNEFEKMSSTPMSTKSTRGSAESTKHQFGSVNSYISFHQKHKTSNSAHLRTNIRGTRCYGSANGHTASKAKTETRPNSFTSVKQFPNFNGYTDLKHLSITGSSPLGRTVQDNELKHSKDFTFCRGKSNFQTCKENVRPEDTASNKDADNSTNGHDSDSDTRAPSLTCTPYKK